MQFPKTCLPHQRRYVVIYPDAGKVQSSCKCLISLFLPWDFGVPLRRVRGSLCSRRGSDGQYACGWYLCPVQRSSLSSCFDQRESEQESNDQEKLKTGYFFLLYSCFCTLRGLEYVRLSGNVCWLADCINPDLVFLLSSGMAFLTIKEWSVLCLGV